MATRIERLTPAHTPRWGRMNVPQMLTHCTDALGMAFGDVPCRERRMPLLRSFPVKHLILYVLPFPKSSPTAPELLARTPENFETERRALLAHFPRFAPSASPMTWAPHPLFGPLSAQEWGVLAHKHLDHHLRQFGV